jgi:hypothetical protein
VRRCGTTDTARVEPLRLRRNTAEGLQLNTRILRPWPLLLVPAGHLVASCPAARSASDCSSPVPRRRRSPGEWPPGHRDRAQPNRAATAQQAALEPAAASGTIRCGGSR